MPTPLLFELRPGADANAVVASAMPSGFESLPTRAYAPDAIAAIGELRRQARALHAARLRAVAEAKGAPDPVRFGFRGRTLQVRPASLSRFGGTLAPDRLFGGSFRPEDSFVVSVDPRDADAVAAALDREAPVRTARVQEGLTAPGITCEVPHQGYLDGAALVGMNARAAADKLRERGFRAGVGAPIGVLDVGLPASDTGLFRHPGVTERGSWRVAGRGGATPSHQDHGLHTLATLFGRSVEAQGVVPDGAPRIRLIDPEGATSTALVGAIAALALEVGPGGVLLIEYELTSSRGRYPVYLHPHIRDIVRAAAYYGVLVVVPSGNQANYLPDWESLPAFQQRVPFGVLMLLVGGVTPRRANDAGTACEERVAAACGTGPRVSCYGWYSDVPTVQQAPPDATTWGVTQWGGTSAAAAMLAGAAALVQSGAVQQTGALLDAFELHAELTDPASGTGAWARVEGEVRLTSSAVGVMPDLAQVLDRVLDPVTPRALRAAGSEDALATLTLAARGIAPTPAPASPRRPVRRRRCCRLRLRRP